MSKMKRAIERLQDLRTAPQGLSLYTKPKPVEVAKPMSAVQRASMASMCGVEAIRDTGYEPVPIGVLREDGAIHKLLDMLETCRPGSSQEEEAYIDKYIMPYNPSQDEYGNLIIEVPAPEGHPKILWSCHTDTVHRHGGAQKVEVTKWVAWTSDGSCLGADDTVGNWLALEMINAKVPGVYVFHRDEESGGRGSSFMAKEHKDWLGTFDCAIALDRADYADVITHQGYERCCSDNFALSLASLIGGKFKPCDTGVFTDTANYVSLIGECTNLSVGYFKQHGPMEHTDLGFAYRLRDALLAADWSKLVFERKPGEVDESDDWYAVDYRYEDRPKAKRGKAYGDLDELEMLEDFIAAYPWVVAEFLHKQGITLDDLELYDREEDL
jgi:hypothetical protein